MVIINTTLQYNSERAAGTGMVINSSGLVLTNNHVIEDSTAITATVPATGRTYQATVLGYDKTRDIALIQLRDASGSTTSETLHGVIQVNADIVAPVNTALSVARQIAAGRASSTVAIGYPPFLGIFVGTGSDSSPQDQAQQGQQQYGPGGSQACSASNAALAAPSAVAPVSSGVLFDGTICGGPAAQSGLAGGAVITAVNGQSVGSPDQLSGVLAQFHPGDTVSVTWVSPAGRRTTSSIRLAAGPPQ